MNQQENTAEQPVIEPVEPTQDMKLPDGSAVVQAIIHPDPSGEGGTMDVRCVLIGADQYNPMNPAHRFMLAVQNRIPEIMAEVTGQQAHLVDASEIDDRLAAGQLAPVVNAAEAKQKLVDGLVALGHSQESAEALVDGITLDPTFPADDQPLEKNEAEARPLGCWPEGEPGNVPASGANSPASTASADTAGIAQSAALSDGLLPVFKVEADGDSLYFAAPTLDRAKQLFRAQFADIPERMLYWSETELRGHPEGMFQDMGIIPE